MKQNVEEMLLGKTRGMSHVRRYSSYPVDREENVAEHTFYVSWYSYCIGMELEDHVHMERLLKKALLHDIEEAATGDILREFKYSDPRLRQRIEKQSEVRVLDMSRKIDPDQNGVSEDLLRYWQKSKDETLEGQIVDLADMLAVVAYAVEESRMGNMVLTEELTNVYGRLDNYTSHEHLGPVAQQAKSIIEEHGVV